MLVFSSAIWVVTFLFFRLDRLRWYVKGRSLSSDAFKLIGWGILTHWRLTGLPLSSLVGVAVEHLKPQLFSSSDSTMKDIVKKQPVARDRVERFVAPVAIWVQIQLLSIFWKVIQVDLKQYQHETCFMTELQANTLSKPPKIRLIHLFHPLSCPRFSIALCQSVDAVSLWQSLAQL